MFSGEMIKTTGHFTTRSIVARDQYPVGLWYHAVDLADFELTYFIVGTRTAPIGGRTD
jgi:hypothetical protein